MMGSIDFTDERRFGGAGGLESGKNHIVILEYSELGSLADSEGKFKGCGGE
jgi:hypothetical protein